MNLLDELARQAAETVQCPEPPIGCASPAGEPCHNLSTGEPLGRQPAHRARVLAAESASPDDRTTR